MNGYTKLIDERWATRTKQPDDSWLPIKLNSEGAITDPEGLVKQIEDDNQKALEVKVEKERDRLMLQGEDYPLGGTVYKVSFTKADGDGLVQVKNGFELGLTTTTIHFENGTQMPISATEFTNFASWFVGKRNEFFTN